MEKGLLMTRIDERDLMFSRMNYKPGTKQYMDYYERHPEKREIDDELRSRYELFSKETPTYDEILSPAADANFDLLEDMRRLCEGPPAGEKILIDPSEGSRVLRNIAKHYGALDAAVVKLDENDFYSFRGRLLENYGDKVDTKLRNTIIFVVRMDKDGVNAAPAIAESVETSRAYVEAAVIALQISYMIRRMGYSARCHMDGNYLIPLIPAAVKAGLGAKGRHSLLISLANGAFVRIGAVTTDMPLEIDNREPLEITRFCKICRRCIKTCPAQTISDSQDPVDWHIDQEACYGRWRHFGTDCGICISTCPIGQDLPAGDIAKMSNKEINDFIDHYNKKFGTRKRTTGKYLR